MSRRFDPAVCCEHSWQGGVQNQRCKKCGARCERNEVGRIVDYDATPAAALYDYGAAL